MAKRLETIKKDHDVIVGILPLLEIFLVIPKEKRDAVRNKINKGVD